MHQSYDGQSVHSPRRVRTEALMGGSSRSSMCCSPLSLRYETSLPSPASSSLFAPSLPVAHGRKSNKAYLDLLAPKQTPSAHSAHHRLLSGSIILNTECIPEAFGRWNLAGVTTAQDPSTGLTTTAALHSLSFKTKHSIQHGVSEASIAASLQRLHQSMASGFICARRATTAPRALGRGIAQHLPNANARTRKIAQRRRQRKIYNGLRTYSGISSEDRSWSRRLIIDRTLLLSPNPSPLPAQSVASQERIRRSGPLV